MALAHRVSDHESDCDLESETFAVILYKPSVHVEASKRENYKMMTMWSLMSLDVRLSDMDKLRTMSVHG